MCAHVLLNSLIELRINCEAEPSILLLFPNKFNKL